MPKYKAEFTYTRVQDVTVFADIEADSEDGAREVALMCIYDDETPGASNVVFEPDAGGEVCGEPADDEIELTLVE